MSQGGGALRPGVGPISPGAGGVPHMGAEIGLSAHEVYARLSEFRGTMDKVNPTLTAMADDIKLLLEAQKASNERLEALAVSVEASNAKSAEAIDALKSAVEEFARQNEAIAGMLKPLGLMLWERLKQGAQPPNTL